MTKAIAVRGTEREGFDYGRMRLWGSLVFILANICGGLSLDAADPQLIIIILAASHGFVFLAVLGLPREIVTADGNLGQRKVQFSDAFRLLGQPVFLTFMIAASLVQASHAVYYGFGTLHWQATGILGGLIGILWSLGVLAEVLLFYVSGRALSLLGPSWLLFVGAAAAILRWFGTSLEPGLFGLVLLQLPHIWGDAPRHHLFHLALGSRCAAQHCARALFIDCERYCNFHCDRIGRPAVPGLRCGRIPGHEPAGRCVRCTGPHIDDQRRCLTKAARILISCRMSRHFPGCEGAGHRISPVLAIQPAILCNDPGSPVPGGLWPHGYKMSGEAAG